MVQRARPARVLLSQRRCRGSLRIAEWCCLPQRRPEPHHISSRPACRLLGRARGEMCCVDARPASMAQHSPASKTQHSHPPPWASHPFTPAQLPPSLTMRHAQTPSTRSPAAGSRGRSSADDPQNIYLADHLPRGMMCEARPMTSASRACHESCVWFAMRYAVRRSRREEISEEISS